MLKKKLLFKEDKSQMNRMKQENDKMLTLYEEGKKETPTRGRQLNNKPNKSSQKNLLTSIKIAQLEKSQGESSGKIKIVQNKSNKKSVHLNSLGYRADSFVLDEDYESSDSDCSIRNNRRRELLEEIQDLPDNLKYCYREVESLNSSQEMDNYEACDDFAFTYGDNLTNEVERILIDIYNNHVSVNSRKKIDISKYEKHIKFFSKTLNKQYNIFILQILSDKIKELISRYKEKIFEIPEIKQIRDRYYEIKANLVGRKLDNNYEEESYDKFEENEKNAEVNKIRHSASGKKCTTQHKCICINNGIAIEKDKKEKGDKISQSMANKAVVSTASTSTSTIIANHSKNNIKSINNQSNQSNKSSANVNQDSSSIEFNESDKSVTKILLLELKKIKKLLIDSSKDIQRVFKLPFSHLKLNNKVVLFSLEDMHREEFQNTLLKDEFIDALITQIKTIAKELKIEEIHYLLSHIEDDPNNQKKEMTRFSAFLFAQLKSLIDSDCDYEDNSAERSNSSSSGYENNPVIKVTSHVNSNSKYQTTNNTSFDNYDNSVSPTNKITNEIGIDELLEYIEKPDEKKIKKNKKKMKKKKNNKSAATSHINNHNHNSSYNNVISSAITGLDDDEEVEKFKKIISESSRNAYICHKIRPNISQEWIKNIAFATAK